MPSGPEIERFELEGANVLCIRTRGRNSVAASRANAPRLCARLEEEGRDGLILDYSDCALEHTVPQFASIAEIFAEAMPRHVTVAYVYSPANMMHALMMTKMLHKAGLKARAFPGWDEAESWIRAELA
ncbi:hypothetical protein F1654_05945 [Alkalicaulis satelles]|uniref:STAS/SEC14 domain-containing protein n=1 Tax=Alkalicaulis satelles TaxID=2609175 RepID=A0A5M6ZF46_9PROT|nr:hypothetical protein [Alkalicaulis satelles]KAA5803349.1 hypothetical protein F1654_05945 [Alkalicaulis satelles]